MARLKNHEFPGQLPDLPERIGLLLETDDSVRSPELCYSFNSDFESC